MLGYGRSEGKIRLANAKRPYTGKRIDRQRIDHWIDNTKGLHIFLLKEWRSKRPFSFLPINDRISFNIWFFCFVKT
jgi:hypothetical protein